MLEALKVAGCYRIFYGIESGNAKQLQLLRKTCDKERIRKIVNETKKSGISAFGYFLIGSPEETSLTAKDTLNFAKSLPLDFAIFNALTPFPKTALYEEYYLPYVDKDFWDEYIKSPVPIDEFIGRPWTKLGDNEIRDIAHRAMLDFYFRPIQIYRCLKSIRSFEQFVRYFYAGLNMIFSFLSKKRK